MHYTEPLTVIFVGSMIISALTIERGKLSREVAALKKSIEQFAIYPVPVHPDVFEALMTMRENTEQMCALLSDVVDGMKELNAIGSRISLVVEECRDATQQIADHSGSIDELATKRFGWSDETDLFLPG